MRKIAAIALCLILLVSMTLSVSAAAGTFLRKEYDVKETNIYAYGKALPQGGSLSVSAGSQVLEDAAVSTLEQEQIPVTVYCLVDVATSRPEAMCAQQEDILYTISSLMSQEDNMVLGQLDEKLEESKPLTDKDARETAIRTMKGTSWATNLYDGMTQALETISTSTSYHTNTVLVVLSDGHDDGKSASDAEKIQEQIRAMGIPVYTVVLNAANLSAKELEEQTRFAQESLGGTMTHPAKDDVSAAVAAQRIWESIKSACVIRIGMGPLQNSPTDQQLLIRYDAKDTRFEDHLLVRALDLAVEVVGEETEETKVDDDEKKDGEEDKEKLYWILGGAAVVLLIGIFAFVKLRRKPEPVQASVSVDDFSFQGGQDLQNDFHPTDFDTPMEQWGATEPLDSWKPTMGVENQCHVYAVALMHPEVAVDFFLTPNVETTFGRTGKAKIILCGDDMKLSGVHGAFYWDGKMLLVRDAGSRNGTAVNGENCHDSVWLRLEQGATLRAGKYEYRINYQNDHN